MPFLGFYPKVQVFRPVRLYSATVFWQVPNLLMITAHTLCQAKEQATMYFHKNPRFQQLTNNQFEVAPKLTYKL